MASLKLYEPHRKLRFSGMAKVLVALDVTFWRYLLQHAGEGMDKGEIYKSGMQVTGKMVNFFELALKKCWGEGWCLTQGLGLLPSEISSYVPACRVQSFASKVISCSQDLLVALPTHPVGNTSTFTGRGTSHFLPDECSKQHYRVIPFPSFWPN